MKRMTILLAATLSLCGELHAQARPEVQSAGTDLLGALEGDVERFERGMTKLDKLMADSPEDPQVMVLYGNGLSARSGFAMQKGDVQNGARLWQSSLQIMASAVEKAPDDAFVRARRAVILISAVRSGNLPPPMAKPLTESAVADFERVLRVREADRSLSKRTTHERGEVLSGIAEGLSRLGQDEKARPYFERITRDLKSTIYDQRARAWLDGKPETRAAGYFSCSGCHD